MITFTKREEVLGFSGAADLVLPRNSGRASSVFSAGGLEKRGSSSIAGSGSAVVSPIISAILNRKMASYTETTLATSSGLGGSLDPNPRKSPSLSDTAGSRDSDDSTGAAVVAEETSGARTGVVVSTGGTSISSSLLSDSGSGSGSDSMKLTITQPGRIPMNRPQFGSSL